MPLLVATASRLTACTASPSERDTRLPNRLPIAPAASDPRAAVAQTSSTDAETTVALMPNRVLKVGRVVITAAYPNPCAPYAALTTARVSACAGLAARLLVLMGSPALCMIG